jgi:tRNA 2-thiouridine synthesizing protein A
MPPPGRHVLDLKGLKCPLPALRTRKAMAGLPAGDVLVVHATDPMSVIDIPHAMTTAGHAVLATSRTGDVISVTIRKGG